MNAKKTPSAFEKYVQETIEEAIQFLRKYGWLDEATGRPDIGKIPGLHEPENVRISVEAEVAVHRMFWNAPAHEYLGNLDTALTWYELGQYEWRGGITFPVDKDWIPDYALRESRGPHLLTAAVCSDRVGNRDRAQELYDLAARHYVLTGDDIKWFVESHQLGAIWEYLPYQAYAQICMGKWADALAALETSDFWAKKDRHAQTDDAYQVQLQLTPTLMALAHYKLDPTAANREAARAKLSLKSIGGRNASERLICYFYWYNLREKFGNELLTEGE